MKKTLAFSLLLGCFGAFVMDGYAATCGQVTISYKGTQKPADNEFLYMNKTQFDKSLGGYNNSGKGNRNSGDGKGIECDNSACKADSMQEMPAGHVWLGNVINKKVTYICVRDKRWEPVSAQECKTQWGSLIVGKSLKGKTTAECSGIQKTEERESLVKSWEVICRQGPVVVCKPDKCIDGYKVNVSSGKCEAVDNKDNKNKDDKNNSRQCVQSDGKTKVDLGKVATNQWCTKDLYDNGAEQCRCSCVSKSWGAPGWQCDVTSCKGDNKEYNYREKDKNSTGGLGVCEKKGGGNDISCKQSRTTEEGKACCDLASAVAKWDGQHCNCTGGKQFKIVNGRGTCTINETCETKYAGNNEAIACCNLSKTTGEATWVEGMNRCVCNDESKTWDKKTFKCVDGGASNPVVPASECWYTLNMDIQCKNGNHFSKNASVKLTNEQVTAAQCDTLKQNMQSIENMLKSTKNEVSTYAEIIKTVCGDNSTSILPYSEVDLKAARETLKSFFANANKNASVWKTEEGNFNGARLASDLTAGVVLGTVGGVVSSKIIKKKQIEKGFEVLHCTIGGQTAADWGDTFTVGLN